jgi:hypothetical protein
MSGLNETFQAQFTSYVANDENGPNSAAEALPMAEMTNLAHQATAQLAALTSEQNVKESSSSRTRVQCCTTEPKAWILGVVCMCVVSSAIYLTVRFLTN